MSDLRLLIREILAEELGRVGAAPGSASQITEERVDIRSNADLAAFATRLLARAQDGKFRADVEAGRHVFRLAESGPVRLEAHTPHAPPLGAQPAVRFDRGLVTEREVAALPPGTSRIEVGRAVRFTPLARDELRRRDIEIERALR